MAFEIGDFNEDGSRYVASLTAKGGAVWEKSKPHDVEKFQTEKNGWRTLPIQDDGHWEHPAGWESVAAGDPAKYEEGVVTDNWELYGNTGIVVPPNMQLHGLDLYFVPMVDLPPEVFSGVLGGVVHIPPMQRDAAGNITRVGYEPGAINTFGFVVSGLEWDQSGNLENVRDWLRCTINSGATFQERHNFMFHLVRPIDWVSNEREFSPSAEIGKRNYINGPDLYINEASSYLRGVRTVPLNDANDNYVFYVSLYIGNHGLTCDFEISPCALEGEHIPELVQVGTGTDGSAIRNWKVDAPTQCVRYVSRMFMGHANPIEGADLEVIDEAVPTSSKPISSRGVAALIEARLDQEKELRELASNARDAAAALQNLEGVKNVIVPIGQSTIVAGKLWVNETKAAITLGDDLTDDGLTALGLTTKLAATVTTQSGQEVFLSTTDLEGVTVADTMAEVGVYRRAGQSDRTYRIEAGKWTENKVTSVREVEVLETVTVPAPYWPVMTTPANTNGSLMVRKGETQVVQATTVLNVGPVGSWQFIQAFGVADRGKAAVARLAVRATDTAQAPSMQMQTSAAGVVFNASMAYTNGAWVASGGTVTIDNGWAVLSVPFTFSATADCTLYAWMTPGTVQSPTVYLSGQAAIIRTPNSVKLTDTDKGNSFTYPLPADIDAKILNATRYLAQTRPPLVTDVFPEGVIWADTTYGTAKPPQWLSKGAGQWQSLGKVTLTKIRLDYTGIFTSYTYFGNIRILKADGTQYAQIWNAGKSSGAGGFPAEGNAYTGGTANPGTNTAAWIELVPRAGEVLDGFSGMIASYRDNVVSTGIRGITLTFSNGFTKTYSVNWNNSNANITNTVTPTMAFPVGEDVPLQDVSSLIARVTALEAAPAPAAFDPKPLTDQISAVDIAGQKTVTDLSAVSGRVTTLERRPVVSAVPVTTTIRDGAALPTLPTGGTISARAITPPAAMPASAPFLLGGGGNVRFEATVTGAIGDLVEIQVAARTAAPGASLRFDGPEGQAIWDGGVLTDSAGGSVTVAIDGDWSVLSRRVTMAATSLTIGAVGASANVFAGPVAHKINSFNYAANGEQLAKKADIPAAPILTPYALKTELPAGSFLGVFANFNNFPTASPANNGSWAVAENTLTVPSNIPSGYYKSNGTTWVWDSAIPIDFDVLNFLNDNDARIDALATWQKFTGNMPRAANTDTVLFTIANKTILRYDAYVIQPTTNRRVNVNTFASGDANHGPALFAVGGALHWYWGTLPTDTRFYGTVGTPATYEIYVKTN